MEKRKVETILIKFFIILSYVLFLSFLNFDVSAQGTGNLGNLILKLLCILFYIFPAIMVLLIAIGGVFIISGDELKRNKGKRLIFNSIFAFFILIFFAWIVTLTTPELKFSDYRRCFSEDEPLVYPTTITFFGEQPPWADARVGPLPDPKPDKKVVYTSPNTEVYFDGSNSIDFDGSIVKYKWDFGDGSPNEFGVETSHTYANDGEYTAELTVTDDDGLTDTDTVKIYIKPLEAHILKPSNNAVFHQIPDMDINFTGEGRYGTPCLPPSEPYTYLWESDVNGFLSNEKSFILKASNLNLGQHTINFTVTDCAGNKASDEITISITERELIAWIINPTSDGITFDCDEKFIGNVTGGKPPYQVKWKANNFVFATGSISQDGETHETTKRPTPPGIYDIKFEVEDQYGAKAADLKKDIEIIPCNPCDTYLATGVLPDKFDWHDYNGENYMSPVRDQGFCGSCWAHSVVGTMEGTYEVEQLDPSLNINLAEEYLVSTCCSCGNCGGCPVSLWPSCPLDYVKNSGVTDESCFPYTGTNSQCSGRCSDWNNRLWKITNWASVSSNEDSIKEALICHGPLSVASGNWGHAIILSGYDDNSAICKNKYGKDGCWIIKNSWGLISGWRSGVWHQNGYGYIPYNGHQYSDLKFRVTYVEGVMPPS